MPGIVRRQTFAVAGLLLLLTGCGATDGAPVGTSSGEATAPTSASRDATPLDGTYRWSTTEEQAIGTAAEDAIGTDWGEEAIASVPNTFTLVLDQGEWAWSGTATKQVDRGTYSVDGDRFEMTWVDPPIPWTLHFTYTKDADGTLHMTPAEQFDEPVNEFIFTYNAWVRVE
jgi:hypothetical protein